MKDWVVIHKIKALYDEGAGSSIKAITTELRISRNTVRKYLRLGEDEISQQQQNRQRSKRLDPYRDYICHLLEKYPRISAVKIERKLRQKITELNVSRRTIRRYVEGLKQVVVVGQPRYYEPVLDMVAGVQCQVDLGEYRHLEIGGTAQTVYFAVFVLSYSRLMYVAAQRTPIDTQSFIELHDRAFRYFGGCPEECVYDQTKLVVLEETFRELTLNQRFAQYATAAGFEVRACEGYDPESKGKVEAGVKYVKNNALYAEHFADWPEFESYLSNWLEEVSNARVHQSTLQVPRQLYESQEKAFMKPYLSPASLEQTRREVRKADRTGLIAWRSNKYSVPLAYQQARVGVEAEADQLVVTDLETNQRIAQHRICHQKGQVIKNTHHYRDPQQRVADLEASIEQRLGADLGARLCQRLKLTSPKIYKDQLVGLRQILKSEQEPDRELLERLSRHATLTATQIRDCLEAVKLRRPYAGPHRPVQRSQLKLALSCYAALGAEGESHGLH
jgi:transposase